ncbi:MAG: hypothetical protein OSB57_01910 [Planctomycetota bacterium]|nr:hypothetical protein [Planctomycetota bacterium]
MTSPIKVDLPRADLTDVHLPPVPKVVRWRDSQGRLVAAPLSDFTDAELADFGLAWVSQLLKRAKEQRGAKP